MSDPYVEFAFGWKDADGNVTKIYVYGLDDGLVRVRACDKNGVKDQHMRWDGSGWEILTPQVLKEQDLHLVGLSKEN